MVPFELFWFSAQIKDCSEAPEHLKAVQALLFRLALPGAVFLLHSLEFTALWAAFPYGSTVTLPYFMGELEYFKYLLTLSKSSKSSLSESRQQEVFAWVNSRCLPCGGWGGMFCVCLERRENIKRVVICNCGCNVAVWWKANFWGLQVLLFLVVLFNLHQLSPNSC